MRKFPWLVMMVMMLGCVPAAPEEPEPSTCAISCPAPKGTPSYGFRLAPIKITFLDGTTVIDPFRLWDTERDEPCSFVRVEGAPARCLPAFVWSAHPGIFEDAACTKLVATFQACKELPRYVRDDTSVPWQTCEPRPLEALIPLGDPLAIGLPLYDMSSGKCETHSNVDAANAAMPLLEPVPLDAFVDGDDGP